jgi:CheY-like chemotaxis protein
MQPILVISTDPQLAEAIRHLLPEGMLQVFSEPDWLLALQLAAHRPCAAILVDVRNVQADAFDIGRILWFRTRRPVLFVDGADDLFKLEEATAMVRAMLEPAHARTDHRGWEPLLCDDIAASKRTATRPVMAADLVHRAKRRFG